VTLADLGQYERSGPPSEDLGRTPPQDIAAEQSVLGGMMLSKDAIADVVEVLRGTDFYRPAHELAYDAVLDLYGRGEPADAVTVAAELTKRGELSRVGGAAYLHTLISSVPTAANAGYYAEIVRERAVLRRLVDAGTKIVQLGYAASGGDVDFLVDSAQAEVYAVTERRTSEDYLPLGDIIEGTIDEIEASSHRGDGLTGVPTGFADLDQLTNGLHPGQMIVIAARPALGKALALDTPLPTPSGWTTMGKVRVGDRLVAADGTPTTVVAATGVMAGRPCYELTFDDGTVVVADAQHQWLTDTRGRHAVSAVRTTEEISRTLLRPGCDQPDHGVRVTRPLVLPEVELAVPGYSFGVTVGLACLGAGAPDAAGVPDAEVVMRAEGEGADLAGLPRPRRIPVGYLRASASQRRAVLAGVLDVAGRVTDDGVVEVRVTSHGLASDVRDLVLGLGYTLQDRPRTDVAFTTSDRVFRLTRKQIAHKERCTGQQNPPVSYRFITSARRVDSVPVRCVEIDHPDHLYLATRSMIPTHNSTMGLDIARSAAIKHGMPTVIFSLEMGRNEITMRLLSAEATVSLQHMRKGTMREEDWTRLARTMGRVSEAPLFIDDSPNMSLMEIRAKCRRLKQQHGLKLVVIDYLQLMSSGKRVESRQQEVSEFSRALKLLAKELEVPVIAISQLNRGAEQRTDKRPQMSDLRESGSIEQDSDIVILLHREDAYERESPRAGEADFIVAKHRNGPTDTIVVAFQGHYSRFVDMAGGV
jgi:replicative DNA helicase